MTLAGIRLTTNTTLRRVIQLYGKPNRVKAWKSGDAKVWDQYECDWVKPGLNLHVVVECPSSGNPAIGLVDLVEVRPGTRRITASTGRGLRIGQSLDDLKRLYGRHYHLRYIPRYGIHDVALAWRGKEYTLVATLNGHNRITSLSLSAPE